MSFFAQFLWMAFFGLFLINPLLPFGVVFSLALINQACDSRKASSRRRQ